MKQRSILTMIFLTIFTLGIYAIVWTVLTKIEMNRRGATIPTAWLMIIPLVNIWWTWKYCEGVELVTREKISAPVGFLMQILLGGIGMFIFQHYFNQVPSDQVQLPQAIAV